MLEKQIEKRLFDSVKAIGGLAHKYTPANWKGAPDRIILLPGGRAEFVELKAPYKKLRKLQEKRRKELEARGFTVHKIDSMKDVDFRVMWWKTVYGRQS